MNLLKSRYIIIGICLFVLIVAIATFSTLGLQRNDPVQDSVIQPTPSTKSSFTPYSPSLEVENDAPFTDEEIKKPWLIYIPFKTRDFLIQYYDGGFKITLYLANATSQLENGRIAEQQNKAKETLDELGVNLNTEKIEWINKNSP